MGKEQKNGTVLSAMNGERRVLPPHPTTTHTHLVLRPRSRTPRARARSHIDCVRLLRRRTWWAKKMTDPSLSYDGLYCTRAMYSCESRIISDHLR